MVSDHNGIKLQISKKNIAGKHHNIWKLNYTLLNTWVKTKSQEKFKKYFKLLVHENKNTTYWNFRDAVKTVLREKFIVWVKNLKRNT